MIADEDGRLHRFRRNLRGLCNEIGKEENKNQTENQALQPFAGGTLPRDLTLFNWLGLKRCFLEASLLVTTTGSSLFGPEYISLPYNNFLAKYLGWTKSSTDGRTTLMLSAKR